MVYYSLDSKQKHRQQGAAAETYVADELAKKGFIIRERNYYRMYGEIDIIAEQKDLVVFVEVKMRSNNQIDMHEIITLQKQRKIGLVAQAYITANAIDNKICRFDVALVKDIAGTFYMTYIADAFTIESDR